MDELASWLETPDPTTFPYDAVVADFHRVGKHFVAEELLARLDRARTTLPHPADAETGVLSRFLSTALDKHDGRFDNPSYLAIAQLPLPGTGDGADDLHRAARQRDRLIALLIADTLRFELAAAEGKTALLPKLRPDARTTAKRCRHGLRLLVPALERLGLDGETAAADPLEAARELCATIAADTTPAERRMLQLTALPVYLAHDEYMFIRVLQSYETTFALAGVQLAAAVGALADGRARFAAQAITAAEQAMREASPLFSIVATMAPEAFLAFREYTEGASAIQSRSYKTVESLCRKPEESRLDSPAYLSVPEVRERVLAGQANLDDALNAVHAAGLLTPDMHHEVCTAMKGFEAALLKWRQTHYRMAVRMLGQRRGTGYTEGVPYLEKARAVKVFASSLAGGAGAPRPAAAMA